MCPWRYLEIADNGRAVESFQAGFPSYLKEMAVSPLPIVVFFSSSR